MSFFDDVYHKHDKNWNFLVVLKRNLSNHFNFQFSISNVIFWKRKSKATQNKSQCSWDTNIDTSERSVLPGQPRHGKLAPSFSYFHKIDHNFLKTKSNIQSFNFCHFRDKLHRKKTNFVMFKYIVTLLIFLNFL